MFLSQSHCPSDAQSNPWHNSRVHTVWKCSFRSHTSYSISEDGNQRTFNVNPEITKVKKNSITNRNKEVARSIHLDELSPALHNAHKRFFLLQYQTMIYPYKPSMVFQFHSLKDNSQQNRTALNFSQVICFLKTTKLTCTMLFSSHIILSVRGTSFHSACITP